MPKRLPLPAITIAAILIAGFASALLAASVHGAYWFASLTKPWFMPPVWLIPVAWTILYILMGLALADLIAAGPRAVKAIRLFTVQLVLNLAWAPVFFRLQRIDQALAVLAALDIVLLATIVLAWRVRGRPAVLLLPYAAWLAFTTALNLAFLVLNG